jgi:hypothetical protein
MQRRCTLPQNNIPSANLDKLPAEVLEMILHLSLELGLIHTCRYFKAALPHFPTLARRVAFAAFCLDPDPDILGTELQDAFRFCDVGSASDRQSQLGKALPEQINLQVKLLDSSWFTLHWFKQALSDSMDHRLQKEWLNKFDIVKDGSIRQYRRRRNPRLLDDDTYPIRVCGTRKDKTSIFIDIRRFYCQEARPGWRILGLHTETSCPYITVNYLPAKLLQPPFTGEKIEFLDLIRRAMLEPPHYRPDVTLSSKSQLEDAFAQAVTDGNATVTAILGALKVPVSNIPGPSG